MEKRKKPELIDIRAENRQSRFSISRDGEEIILTNGEVYEAARAMILRASEDALLWFADIYGNDSSYEIRKVIADNIVKTVLDGMTREILEQANAAMGREKAVPVDYLLNGNC